MCVHRDSRCCVVLAQPLCGTAQVGTHHAAVYNSSCHCSVCVCDVRPVALDILLDANGLTRDELVGGAQPTHLEMFLHDWPRVRNCSAHAHMDKTTQTLQVSWACIQ